MNADRQNSRLHARSPRIVAVALQVVPAERDITTRSMTEESARMSPGALRRSPLRTLRNLSEPPRRCAFAQPPRATAAMACVNSGAIHVAMSHHAHMSTCRWSAQNIFADELRRKPQRRLPWVPLHIENHDVGRHFLRIDARFRVTPLVLWPAAARFRDPHAGAWAILPARLIPPLQVSPSGAFRRPAVFCRSAPAR